MSSPRARRSIVLYLYFEVCSYLFACWSINPSDSMYACMHTSMRVYMRVGWCRVKSCSCSASSHSNKQRNAMQLARTLPSITQHSTRRRRMQQGHCRCCCLLSSLCLGAQRARIDRCSAILSCFDQILERASASIRCHACAADAFERSRFASRSCLSVGHRACTHTRCHTDHEDTKPRSQEDEKTQWSIDLQFQLNAVVQKTSKTNEFEADSSFGANLPNFG